MAKLYFNPEFGSVVARKEGDEHGVEEMIEITAEQGVALSLSFVGQAISNLYDVLEDKLGR